LAITHNSFLSLPAGHNIAIELPATDVYLFHFAIRHYADIDTGHCITPLIAEEHWLAD